MVELLIENFDFDNTNSAVANAWFHWYNSDMAHMKFNKWLLQNYNLEYHWKNDRNIILTGNDEDYTAFVLKWA